MADSNFQDVVSLTGGTLQVLGQAISVGTDAGAKSVVLANNAGALHLNANPTATRSILLPDAAGTVALMTAISAGTTLASNGQLVISNSNALSFGINGSTLTAKMPSISYWDNPRQGLMATFSLAVSSSFISLQRISIPFQISATELDVLAAVSIGAGLSGTYTISAALYTFAASTASTVSSSSVSVSFGGAGAAGASNYNGHSGTRWRTMPTGTWNMTPGEYLLAFAFVQNASSVSLFGGTSISVGFAVGSTNTAGRSNVWNEGIYSAQTAAFPTSIQLSQVSQGNNATVMAQPYVRLIGTF